MFGWILLEELLPLQRPFNILGRNFPLFDNAVRKNGSDSPMKEIQNAEFHSFPPNPQFVDAIPEQVPTPLFSTSLFCADRSKRNAH